MFAKPVVLPNVTPAMLNPEFWLERWKANPEYKDKALLSQEVSENREAYRCNAGDIRESLAEYLDLLDYQRNRIVYNASGEEIAGWPVRLDCVIRTLGTDLEMGYGLIVSPASLKFLPSPVAFFNESAQPRDLDRNQLSGLDPGDKVVVLKETPLNGYCPVVCERGAGWVPFRDIAFGSEELITSFRRCRHRRLIVDSKAALLGPDGLIPVSMGSGFPNYPGREVAVLLPKRRPGGRLTFGKGIIAGESAPDFLPPSEESCIRQAFKYLGCHYAWGDEDIDGRGRDCSRFVQDVMAAMGIKVPRNSRKQFKAGVKRIDLRGLPRDERCRIIRSGSLGNLLFTDGHVMIYLGATDQSLYIIHACYQYKEGNCPEYERRIKQVAVSDLALGEGTSTGSLLDRLIGMVEIF